MIKKNFFAFIRDVFSSHIGISVIPCFFYVAGDFLLPIARGIIFPDFLFDVCFVFDKLAVKCTQYMVVHYGRPLEMPEILDQIFRAATTLPSLFQSITILYNNISINAIIFNYIQKLIGDKIWHIIHFNVSYIFAI